MPKKPCRRCQRYVEVVTVIERQFIKIQGGEVWGCVCTDICTVCKHEIGGEEQRTLDQMMLAEMQQAVRQAQEKGP